MKVQCNNLNLGLYKDNNQKKCLEMRQKRIQILWWEDNWTAVSIDGIDNGTRRDLKLTVSRQHFCSLSSVPFSSDSFKTSPWSPLIIPSHLLSQSRRMENCIVAIIALGASLEMLSCDPLEED